MRKTNEQACGLKENSDLKRQRRCHDCGKPTPDCRCAQCWEAHRREVAGHQKCPQCDTSRLCTGFFQGESVKIRCKPPEEHHA